MDAIDQAYENLRQKRDEDNLNSEDAAIDEQYATLAGIRPNPEVQNKIKQIEDKILNKPAQEVDYLGESIAGLAPIAATLLFGGEASRIALPQTINQSRDIYGSIKKEQQQADLNQDKRLANTYGSLLKQDSADKQRQVAIQRLQQQMAKQKADDEQKMLDREQRALDRQEARALQEKLFQQGDATRRENAKLLAGFNQARLADSRDTKAQIKAEKDAEKLQELETPYGLAKTKDDAKKLKEAFETKRSFDNKLDQLIELREKYGGEVTNRDAVATGERLSNDLLLDYKNLAKLGVLSVSDEKIINSIIPKDPLKFRSPLAAIRGQDPILANLKGFKKDKEQDFAARIEARTRTGAENPAIQSVNKPTQSAPSFTSDDEKRLQELEAKAAARRGK